MRPDVDLQTDVFRTQPNKRLSGLGTKFVGLLGRLQGAFRCRKDMQKLKNMPDYLLRDMGIERSAIEATGFVTLLFSSGSNH